METRIHRECALRLLFGACLLALASAAAALPLTIDATVSDLGGAAFRYRYAFTNGGLEDIALVSLHTVPNDASLGNLAAPPGYFTLYDGPLGIVDFLPELGSPDFLLVGMTVGDFGFDSLLGPGPVLAEALTVGGQLDRRRHPWPERRGDSGADHPVAGDGRPRRAAPAAPARALTTSRGGLTMRFTATLIVGCALAAAAGTAHPASHSDAPLIKQDPQANITDVYAFIGTKYDNPGVNVLNVIVQVRPFSELGDGVMYDRFADDALYSIHITHPATGAQTLRYDFRFSAVDPQTTPGLKNPNTILSYGLGAAAGPISSTGDAQQNYTQTYSVTRTVGGVAGVIGSNLKTPPPNVGQRVTPLYNDATTGRAISGATTFAALDGYTRETVTTLATGEAVFAGPREDGFYADTPAIFDLLDARILDNDGDPSDGLGQDGGGVDGFKGYNVLSFALQIPVTALQTSPYVAPFADLGSGPLPAIGEATGVGVYASVSRPRTTLRRSDGRPVSSGPWIQVNRMGNPLFNETLVPLKDKDRYNRTAPTGDSTFATYAVNPELALYINFIVGTTFATSGRSDLAAVYIPPMCSASTPPPRPCGWPARRGSVASASRAATRPRTAAAASSPAAGPTAGASATMWSTSR